jgi:hypothetical protein
MGNKEECEGRGVEGERSTPSGEDLFVMRLYFSFVLFHTLPGSQNFPFAVNTHCLYPSSPHILPLIIN